MQGGGGTLDFWPDAAAEGQGRGFVPRCKGVGWNKKAHFIKKCCTFDFFCYLCLCPHDDGERYNEL